LERWSSRTIEKIPQGTGIIWGLTVTICAGDNEQEAFRYQGCRGIVYHTELFDSQTHFHQATGELVCNSFSIPGLRGEENGHNLRGWESFSLLFYKRGIARLTEGKIPLRSALSPFFKGGESLSSTKETSQ
jgi:hypothetical protein